MTEKQKADDRLMEELQALGQQLTTAVRALWESEDSRKLRQEIGDGFMELGRQLDTAVKTAQESEAAKEFSQQVKGAMDKARESEVANRLEEGLVVGLRDLNEGLSKLVASMGSGRAPTPKEEAGGEDAATTPDVEDDDAA